MKNAARVAYKLGLKLTNGFTCPSIWHMLYSFRPFSHKSSDDGFAYFAGSFDPSRDVFDNEGVRLGLRAHPSEIDSEMSMAHWPLEALGRLEPFGFDFDASHLDRQRVDPAKFLGESRNGIYHVHMKDAALNLAGVSAILTSRLNFGRPDQGRTFQPLGHGGLNFKEIIRTLNRTGYRGLFRSSGKIAGWITQRRKSMPADSLRTWASSRPIGRSTPPMRSEACLV